MSLKLTNEQFSIYNKLTDFINSNDNELLLIGYAGTGKTTLVAKFINDMINTKKCKKIAIVAPTHQAVNIAKSKLFSNSTEKIKKQVEITTIHSLLFYRQYVDTTGNKYFAKGKSEPDFSKYNLVIIDECSMLSNQIINDIDKYKKLTKILYVGDPAQLPPVNHSESKIFNKNITKLQLETIVRTKNNAVQLLSQDHRKWIFDFKKMPNLSNFLCDEIKAESSKNINKWLDKFVKIIKSKKKKHKNANNSIILTWTNEKCNKYNQYIRKKIFNKENLNEYEVDEILIVNGHHKIEDITFRTSEKIKVVKVLETQIEFDKFKEIKDSTLPKNVTKLVDKFIIETNKLLENKFNIFSLDINKISDILDKIEPLPAYNMSIMKTNEKYDEIKKKFTEIIQNLEHETKHLISKFELNDMEKTNYLADISKKINAFWRKWNSNVIDKIAQLNYGYAITCHKSQSATFEHIFIDIDDILSNKNQLESLKCLYTAITRCECTISFLLP
jgi:hypothetical protein